MSGVIVGVDRSDTARCAAFRAAALATALDQPLYLVTAVKGAKSIRVYVGAEQFFDVWLPSAAEFLQSLKWELGVENTTTGVVCGGPAASLCEEAARIDASIIVVGNRRVHGTKRMLGSVAADVTRQASCDVLVANTVDRSVPPAAHKPIRHSITSAHVFQARSAKQMRQIERPRYLDLRARRTRAHL